MNDVFMEFVKKIKLIIFPITAIFIIIFSEFVVKNLHYTIFALLLVYGIENITRHFILKQKFDHLTNIYWGIMEIILGILVLCTGNEQIPNICIIWGVWSLLRESNEVKHVVCEVGKKRKINIFHIIDLVESAVAIVFSIFLVLSPTEHHALIHINLLAIELTLNASLPFFKKWRENKEIIKED